MEDKERVRKITVFRNNLWMLMWCFGIISITFFLFFVNTSIVCAWNSSSLHDIDEPDKGLNSGGKTKTHEWIVHEALQYLKDHNYISEDSWFGGPEFEKYIQWGVAYADHTDKTVFAGCDVFPGENALILGTDYDLDGNHHFYHPAAIEIKVNTIDETGTFWGGLLQPITEISLASCGDVAHVGDLTAPLYAGQLYQRAVEFWPGGSLPLNLNNLAAPWDLGFVRQGDLDILHFAGWANGTDPRYVWQVPNQGADYDPVKNNYCGYNKICGDFDEICISPTPNLEDDLYGIIPSPRDNCENELVYTCQNRYECVKPEFPKWPSWASDGKQAEKTAAIYLGWALHMVQDMGVIHHTTNLHGTYHQEYERRAEDMINKDDHLSDTLPVAHPSVSGESQYCEKIPPPASSYGVEARIWTKHCVDLFPHLAFSDLDVWDAEDLANYVAAYAYYDAEGMIVPCLDASIKATGALIYKFINDISKVELEPDKFEPNNNIYQKRKLQPGSYYNLSLHNLMDEDYFLINMPYQGDLEINIEYDTSLAQIGLYLDGPSGMYWPMKHANGKILLLEGIAAGNYTLYIEPINTTFYNLHLKISDKKLTPDWREDNDTPETADITLLRYSGNTPGLNIDRLGDDDYYLVESDIGYRIDLSIVFDPGEGDLSVFLNKDEAEIVNESSPNERKMSLSKCSSGKDIVRVTGDPNYYSISLKKTFDYENCGFDLSSNSQPGKIVTDPFVKLGYH